MAKYQYKVVPFMGVLNSGETADKVSIQLQALIDEYVNQGWDFYIINDVSIQVKPGCLQGLLGAKDTYMTYDQVVFRKLAS